MVDGVSSSNNHAALYASGAAVVGGIAGGATGYYTKSILKDGVLTDEFVKKSFENIGKIYKEDVGKLLKDIEAKKLKPGDINSVDEAKAALIEAYREMASEVGKSLDNAAIDKYKKSISKKLENKTLEECINIVNEEAKWLGIRYAVEAVMKVAYDIDKKAFITLDANSTDAQKAQLKSLKDAASSIKWKAAGIYGAIGAAVLGLVTYIGVNMSSNKTPDSEAKEKIHA